MKIRHSTANRLFPSRNRHLKKRQLEKNLPPKDDFPDRRLKKDDLKKDLPPEDDFRDRLSKVRLGFYDHLFRPNHNQNLLLLLLLPTKKMVQQNNASSQLAPDQIKKVKLNLNDA